MPLETCIKNVISKHNLFKKKLDLYSFKHMCSIESVQFRNRYLMHCDLTLFFSVNNMHFFNLFFKHRKVHICLKLTPVHALKKIINLFITILCKELSQIYKLVLNSFCVDKYMKHALFDIYCYFFPLRKH